LMSYFFRSTLCFYVIQVNFNINVTSCVCEW